MFESREDQNDAEQNAVDNENYDIEVECLDGSFELDLEQHNQYVENYETNQTIYTGKCTKKFKKGQNQNDENKIDEK